MFEFDGLLIKVIQLKLVAGNWTTISETGKPKCYDRDGFSFMQLNFPTSGINGRQQMIKMENIMSKNKLKKKYYTRIKILFKENGNGVLNSRKLF